jgi:hypothetical protein
MPNRLLAPKELAAALGRHRSFVFAMKKAGFPMPGNRATLAEAQSWLARNPRPRRRELRKSGRHYATP